MACNAFNVAKAAEQNSLDREFSSVATAWTRRAAGAGWQGCIAGQCHLLGGRVLLADRHLPVACAWPSNRLGLDGMNSLTLRESAASHRLARHTDRASYCGPITCAVPGRPARLDRAENRANLQRIHLAIRSEPTQPE